ncbi:hypothetical protein Scep_004323 [Stephania cephalantha]|uniref:Uncharacterized protein n=1 Tax=Stephania cephalantha TaxID=152367 RepID=A0AAP0PX76_9MAGN
MRSGREREEGRDRLSERRSAAAAGARGQSGSGGERRGSWAARGRRQRGSSGGTAARSSRQVQRRAAAAWRLDVDEERPRSSGGVSAAGARRSARTELADRSARRHRPADDGCAAAQEVATRPARPRTMAGGEQRSTQQRRRAAGRQRRDRIRDDDGQRRRSAPARGGPAGAWRWPAVRRGSLRDCAVEMRSSGGRAHEHQRRPAAERQRGGRGQRWAARWWAQRRNGVGRDSDVGSSDNGNAVRTTRCALSGDRRRESTNVERD